MNSISADASKFLKPPGWFKRRFKGNEIRFKDSLENPITRMIRQKEKSRKFHAIPEPRQIPMPKKTVKNHLSVSGRFFSDSLLASLDHRLEFLLSTKAIDQQKTAPLLPGMTAYQTELFVWENQMRDIRKIYRAQYLNTLAEVTKEESQREVQAYREIKEERRIKHLELVEKKSMELKTQAILSDQKRVESRVNESIEIARRVQSKEKKLEILTQISADEPSPSLELDRDVNSSLMLGQMGSSKFRVPEKSKKMERKNNIFREVLEKSYNLVEEHTEFSPLFESLAEDDLFDERRNELTPEERADLYYVGFSDEEKLELIDKKISMLNQRLRAEEIKGSTDIVTQQLIDILGAAKAAHLEKQNVETLKRENSKDVDDQF
jgi:hypothetical protein